LKQNARKLIEAEVIVRVFNDTIQQGHHETSPLLLSRLSERCYQGQKPSAAIKALIPDVYSAYEEVQSRWKETPIGETLNLHWRGKRKHRALPR
jgi:hypothetical protein